MVALSPRPNETVKAMTLANCSPWPKTQQQTSGEHDRKKPRQDADQHDDGGPEGDADKCRDENDFDRQPSAQFIDHERAVAGGNHRQARHADFVTGIFCPQAAQLLVYPIDDRKELTGVPIRNATADDHRILFSRNEPACEIGRQHVDILFERIDVRLVQFLCQPLAQRVQGPDVADAGLVLKQRMHIVNDRQSFGRIERSLRKLDVNVEWICAGQFEVEAMAGLDCLFAVGHLLGQPKRAWSCV